MSANYADLLLKNSTDKAVPFGFECENNGKRETIQHIQKEMARM